MNTSTLWLAIRCAAGTVASAAVLALTAAPMEAASFDGAQTGPNEWTYTLTFDPLDNYAVCPSPGNVATITLSGLAGVVGATPPTSTDFPPGLIDTINLLWSPAVSGGGTVVTWTHLGPGTGNLSDQRRVFGFKVFTATPAVNGAVNVASDGFSLDVSVIGPCPVKPADDRDFKGTTNGPAGPAVLQVSATGTGTFTDPDSAQRFGFRFEATSDPQGENVTGTVFFQNLSFPSVPPFVAPVECLEVSGSRAVLGADSHDAQGNVTGRVLLAVEDNGAPGAGRDAILAFGAGGPTVKPLCKEFLDVSGLTPIEDGEIVVEAAEAAPTGCPDASPLLTGPTGCTVLQSGSPTGKTFKVSIDGPPPGVHGNLCVGAGSRLSASGGGTVTLDVFLDPGPPPAICTSSSQNIRCAKAKVEELDADISKCEAFQTPKPCTPAAINGLPNDFSRDLFTLGGPAHTITGGPGENVICVSRVSLDGSKVIHLDGSATTTFVIQVAANGVFSLSGSSQIKVDGTNVQPADVVYNVLGAGPTVHMSGSTVLDGSLIGVRRNISITPGTINGGLCGDRNIKLSGASVCPAGQARP